MKRCPNCTHENAQTNMYCESCGTPLVAPQDVLSDQTYASVNEAYTTSGESSFTTQEQAYSTPVPPPPPVYPMFQASTDVPPPPPTYYTPSPAQSAYYTPSPVSNYGYDGPTPTNPPRSFGAALLSAILYLIGAFCFAFGVAGFMLYGTASMIIGFVFIALSIIALIAMVILLIMRKRLVLKWWARVLIILGLTILATVALFGSAALNRTGSNYTSFGIIFIIYGLVTASMAFW